MKVLNLIEKRFGRLLVIARVENDKFGHSKWLCKCDCGNEVVVLGDNLKKTNHSKSCGCYHREKARKANTTHGYTKGRNRPRVYRVWQNMKTRCYNPESKDAKLYKERGIIVHEEWIMDFEAFYKYVAQLEHFNEEGYSLDRIDSNGNYAPGNLRWATALEQRHNQRRCGKVI